MIIYANTAINEYDIISFFNFFISYDFPNVVFKNIAKPIHIIGFNMYKCIRSDAH